MMKKYVAPQVQITNLDEVSHLLAGSPEPAKGVYINANGEKVTIMGGGDEELPDNIYYSKGNDSWALWDE